MRHDEYRTYDGLGLAHLIRAKQVTAAELLEIALQHAAATDPQIAALVYTEADRARRAIAAGLPDGPFTGVPFVIKDLGCEAVDFPTCMGSRLYRASGFTMGRPVFGSMPLAQFTLA